jgi:hypothetical protein
VLLVIDDRRSVSSEERAGVKKEREVSHAKNVTYVIAERNRRVSRGYAKIHIGGEHNLKPHGGQ